MTSRGRPRGNQRCDGGGAAGSGSSSGRGEVACVIIVTHYRYTAPSDRRQRPQQQRQSNRQNLPNFNRDNFNFSLYQNNLSCTSSIQDKRKHFLPQVLQMNRNPSLSLKLTSPFVGWQIQLRSGHKNFVNQPSSSEVESYLSCRGYSVLQSRSTSCRKVTKMTLRRAHRTSMSQIVANKQTSGNAYHTMQATSKFIHQNNIMTIIIIIQDVNNTMSAYQKENPSSKLVAYSEI